MLVCYFRIILADGINAVVMNIEEIREYCITKPVSTYAKMKLKFIIA